MSFESSLDMTSNGVARITLSGKLDSSTYREFEGLIGQAIANKAKRVALLLGGLSFMASAGLRVLVFAKQKLGSSVDIYVIEAQEQVVDTITMTGLEHSVTMLDSYDAAVVEKF
ncbi:STAS domain-containing protein [Desulfobulbus sp. F5]|nr:STAS domain-containing protein [Desulfobulbus sp. F5]